MACWWSLSLKILLARWSFWGQRRDRGARILHPGVGWVQLGPSLGAGRGNANIGGEWTAGPAHPGTFSNPFSFLSCFLFLSLPHCPWSPSGYLISPFFFLVVRTVSPMLGQLPAMRGGAPATGGRAPGGQRSPEDRICSGQVEGWKPLWHLAGG